MMRTLAAAVAATSVPRIAVATPSLTSLDACAIVKAAALSSLPVLAGTTPTEDAFGSGCELSAKSLFFYLDTAIADKSVPVTAKAVSIGGHRIYASTSNGGGYCTFISVQGRTADGKNEQLVASSNSYYRSKAPTELCAQTGQALAKYLDTAGLR